MDSGIGGLTVLRKLIDRFPGEHFIYFGDTARVPYGIHSAPVITRYTREIIDFFLRKKIKLGILACNTASALALPVIEDDYTVPLVGVVKAGARAAAGYAKHGTVAIIATKATIASGAYKASLHALAPKIKTVEAACPLFVPLVEESWIDHPVTRLVAKTYLTPLLKAHPKALILGCTHYPLLSGAIAKIMGPAVKLIDSPSAVAHEVASLLDSIGHAPGTKTKVDFFVTDDAEGFKRKARFFFGGPLPGPICLVRL